MLKKPITSVPPIILKKDASFITTGAKVIRNDMALGGIVFTHGFDTKQEALAAERKV